jgi:hypothetical protein
MKVSWMRSSATDSSFTEARMNFTDDSIILDFNKSISRLHI